MECQPKILDKIHMLYDTFYAQEKKVAAFIIKNPGDVIHMTITELAQSCGTSVATITRFCRKCSADSFHQLKITLAGEITEAGREIPASNTISRDSVEQSLQNILTNKIAELQETVSLLDSRLLSQVLDTIRQAGIVQLAAVGNTIPVAIDGAYRFSEIGIRAVAGTVWETQLAFSMSLGKNDAMIAISNSGESKQVYKMVSEAKKRGVKTIGITNNPHSSIGSIVDFHIQTVTRERLFLNEFCFSRISAMTVIEILYLFLTVGDHGSYEKLKTCENLIADEKL